MVTLRKIQVALLVLMLASMATVIFLNQTGSFTSHGNHCNVTRRRSTSRTKFIHCHLFPAFYKLKPGRHHFSSCNRSCVMTVDPKLITEADTVVLYSHHYKDPGFLRHFPPQLQPPTRCQTWVFFARESPARPTFTNDLFGRPEWHHRFNWTMTYRRDSDLYYGYGAVVRRRTPISPSNKISAVIAGKSKMVAWFVSHCNASSKRDDLARALNHFVRVDVYGRCGSLTCDHRKGYTKCREMLSRDFYFYLAFENTLCTDYVTEKLYGTMKNADVVPVVYGGAKYSAYLPKQSYIDAEKFATVRQLANYLKRVASDRKLYKSYFDYRKQWRVVQWVPIPFCDLCWRSHHPQLFHKVYDNVYAWWSQGHCRKPNLPRRS